MANPQRENGHVDIANEIIEKFMRLNLCKYEWRVLWAILRKTYGWHKKGDHISYSQLQEMTGISKWHLGRAIKGLVDKKIIVCRPKSKKIKGKYVNYYKFQKNYDLWDKKFLITNFGNADNRSCVTNLGNESVTYLGNGSITYSGNNKRKYIKETIKRKKGFSIPNKIQCPFCLQGVMLHNPDFIKWECDKCKRKKNENQIKKQWEKNKGV